MVGEVDPSGDIGDSPANRRGQDALPAHCRLEQVVGPALPAGWDVTSLLTVLAYASSHLARDQLLADATEPRAPAIPWSGAAVTPAATVAAARDDTRTAAGIAGRSGRAIAECVPVLFGEPPGLTLDVGGCKCGRGQRELAREKVVIDLGVAGDVPAPLLRGRGTDGRTLVFLGRHRVPIGVAAQEVGDLVHEPEAERGYVGPLKHCGVEVHVPVAVNRVGGEVPACSVVG